MVATNMYGANQTPNFKWPQPETYQHNDEINPTILQESVTDEGITNVVNTVKNIVDTFMQNQTEKPILTTTINFEETMDSNNIVMGVDGSTINEMFNSNSTLMTFNNTGITETINSNNTIMNFNTITEMADTTITSVTEESTNPISTISDTVSTVVDSVSTTSKSVFNTFGETVTSAMSTESATEDNLYDSEHYGHFAEEKTLYIVIGVILGALLLLIIILLIIYKRYKAQSGIRSGVYCVTDLNEVSISSCERKGAPVNQRISNFT